MVAEDELLILENLVKKINSMSLPFCVKGAFEDGDSALEFIKTNHVDLVITDIKMPFMNGLELSRVLHASYPSIKILIKNSIFRNSLIFQGLPPIKYQNLMYFPLFLPL